MRQHSIGVASHEVHLEKGLPVSVTLVLANGTEAIADLVGHTVTWLKGPPLTLKKQAWLWQIGEYLARQFLQEVAEQALKNRQDGRQVISFEPRSDPNLIWWG